MLKIHGSLVHRASRISWLRLTGVMSCCALGVIFALMLFPALPQSSHALSVPGGTEEAATGTSVGISIPATIDFASVTPTPNGATTTATAELVVTTSNSASYNLYLYSSDGDNSLRPANSANISQINATAGDVGLTLSSLKPNTWGYNLGTSAPDDNTIYSAVPTNDSTPIQTKDTSATAQADDHYTLSLGANVDTSIPSGRYSATLVVAVVAEPATMTLAFNGNGADGGEMEALRLGLGEERALPANTFTRKGYIFNGWNTDASGGGVSYADGDTYVAPGGSSGQVVTLYAQWRLPVNQLDDVTYMQDLTASHCANSDNGVTATLLDKRDNNSYRITKINGQCWMTQNLRLAGETVLDSSTSNIETSYTLPSDSTNGFSSYTYGSVHYSGDADTGSWYSFCAASAGTVCQGSYSQDAAQDICPAGWRLPTVQEQEGLKPHVDLFEPVAGGYYYYSALGNPSYGYWWSSTAMDNQYYQYFLTYDGSGLSVYIDFNKCSGLYVRCVHQ